LKDCGNSGGQIMQLEDFLDFEPPPLERIRLRGTRINLEHLVSLFTSGMTPEQIHAYFGQWPPVEKIYGAITYFLNNRDSVNAYIARVEAAFQEEYERNKQEPESEVVKRLRALKAERATATGAST
jgi:uncharacterized protein (DUF433 family)